MSRKDRLNYYAVQAFDGTGSIFIRAIHGMLVLCGEVIEGQNSATLLSSTVDLDKDRLFSQELLFALFVDISVKSVMGIICLRPGKREN